MTRVRPALRFFASYVVFPLNVVILCVITLTFGSRLVAAIGVVLVGASGYIAGRDSAFREIGRWRGH